MSNIKLFNTPDITWVLKDKNCIRLFAVYDLMIEPSQVITITFNDFNYICDKDVVGVPYLTKKSREYELYYPEGTNRWHGSDTAKVVIHNKSFNEVKFTKGDHICNINLMTVQYFDLMRKHNNSDKGLASKLINIEML
jgi:hypothetical protein